jgi:hypothetical protein
MPLVKDFGEHLQHACGALHPRTQLVFTRDSRIFGQFAHFVGTHEEVPVGRVGVIKPIELPPKMQIDLGDDGSGVRYTREDPYGGKIVWVPAKQLKTLVMPADTTPSNHAIKAYIDELVDDTPVIMMWQ